MVDELGTLEKWANEKEEDSDKTRAAKFSRIETLRKSLREIAGAKCPANESCKLSGFSFVALLGPKTNGAAINNAAAAKLLGTDTFVRIAKVTLESLKAFPGVTAQVVSDVFNVGPRSLKTYPKAAS